MTTDCRRLVAFLRGINLGGRRVTNDELRTHFEALGLTGAAPFLASGNVVFDAPGSDHVAVERTIEAHLEESLGYPVPTFVRSLEALERLTRLDAVSEAPEDVNIYVTFLRRMADDGIGERLRELETPDDRFTVEGREVVWLRRGGISDSDISTRELESALGGADHTRRNLNTVRRILSKFGGQGTSIG